ncbi:MAG: UDP-N-acetylmuramate dehydrogenase [Clostridia bacterium]|nr:UDP-N-acetylmuramate dehydrogenase [Clostridia bacterium]
MLLYKSGLKNLISAQKVKTVSPFEFAKNTTYGLGGNAPVAYYPKTPWQAKMVFDELSARGERFTVIGNGSNLLVSDSGFSGAVISTRKLSGIVRLSNNRLLCLAGTKISDLLLYCRVRGLGGLEYLYGIPATVGGAAFMNAGVNGATIGNNIISVNVYNGKSLILSNENCNFGYRHSTMRDINALILSVIVKVDNVSAEEIDRRIDYYKTRRKHLPRGKSCGCVFKNPEGHSGGQLIDAAGFKGLRYGGAVVSNSHANFIINDGGSAQDVKELIYTVKRGVFDKFGILLEEEVVYIGDF